MEPEEWGPSFWYTGHTISFYFPENPTEEEKQAAKSFYLSLAYLLPCDTCCEEYSNLLSENPIDDHLSSPDSLSRWFFNIHEKVNIKLGKRSKLNYETVKNKFMKVQPKYKVNSAVLNNYNPRSIQQQQQHQNNFQLNRSFNSSKNHFSFTNNGRPRGNTQYNEQLEKKGGCSGCGRSRRRTKKG